MKAVLAIVIGALGLFMTTCGLYFMSFLGVRNMGLLAMTLPSIVVGLLLIWGAQTLWRRHKAALAKPEDKP